MPYRYWASKIIIRICAANIHRASNRYIMFSGLVILRENMCQKWQRCYRHHDPFPWAKYSMFFKGQSGYCALKLENSFCPAATKCSKSSLPYTVGIKSSSNLSSRDVSMIRTVSSPSRCPRYSWFPHSGFQNISSIRTARKRLRWAP